MTRVNRTDLHDGVISLQLPECISLQNLLCILLCKGKLYNLLLLLAILYKRKKNTEYKSWPQSISVLLFKLRHHANVPFTVNRCQTRRSDFPCEDRRLLSKIYFTRKWPFYFNEDNQLTPKIHLHLYCAFHLLVSYIFKARNK